LAVSLLQDRHGTIDINLPISGSLDDPQFSVGGLILRVILNLFVKVVTAPFSLLASMFGDGQELSYIEFAPGSAELSADSLARIATLSKVLADRPALKLDISGRVDPNTDMEGLRQAWVESQILAAKTKAEAGGKQKPDIGNLEISPAQREQYLKQVYDDTRIKGKPRNLIGISKSIPPDQMQALLRAAAPVQEAQLHQLADARAQAVYEKLQADEDIAARVFIVAPQWDAQGIKDQGLPSRVEFSLQ
jgi:hypothetical protein